MESHEIREAAQALVAHKPVVALTGAGVSVEAGVPDFRSPGGIWTRFDPEEYATAEALALDPDKTWTFFVALFDLLESLAPGPSHRALADLEASGVLSAVITQNIDGLHQAGGSQRVIEYHGGPTLSCMGCGARIPQLTERQRDEARSGRAPRHTCGGIIRPDVILFGEEIPPAAMRQSEEVMARAHGVLVVGTSAQVWPAAGIPQAAAQRGAPVIEVNLEETPVSRYASVSIRAPAAQALPALAAEVRRLLGRAV